MLQPCHFPAIRHLLVQFPMVYGALQVVFVVAGDLGMSPGKLAAQVAHAAVGLHRVLLEGRYPWLPAWEVKNRCAICSTPADQLWKVL